MTDFLLFYNLVGELIRVAVDGQGLVGRYIRETGSGSVSGGLVDKATFHDLF